MNKLDNSFPRFTVIIPTKDRCDYLYHTLRTCSLQDYDNLEIVVSDDGSSDNTKEMVLEASRKDPRINYFSPSGNIGVGMRDNFEFALNQVNPGYVIALGGDDGLLPNGIVKMHEVLKETNQKMLSWPAPAYLYPKTRMETAQLILHSRWGKPQGGNRIIETKDFLNRQAKNLSYASDIESPMFYVKGVVSTDLIEKVKQRSKENRFYSCSTPDGYSGIVLAGEISTYAFSNEPFSIYGLSNSSQGMSYLASDEKSKQRSQDFFKGVMKIPMHSELASQPYSPLISLMTADYLLTARDLPGWQGKFTAINYKELLIKSLDELAHGLYANERLSRELFILNQIAEQYELGDFFRKLVKSSKRKIKKKPIEGNAISGNYLFLDCSKYQIDNIFDAAFVAFYYQQIALKTNIIDIGKALFNSIRYKINSSKKGESFLDETCWELG